MTDKQVFQLSPQQQHLYYCNQQPGWSECTIYSDIPIARERLAHALQTVIDRHGALRTCFRRSAETTTLHQVFEATGVFTLIEEEDLSSKIKFDLEGGPAFFAVLESSSRLLLKIYLPSLCTDAISLQHLFEEIRLAYDSGENKLNLTDAVQYEDVVPLLNELLESEDTRSGRDYWLKQKVHGDFQLPFARKTEDKPFFEPGVVEKSLPRETLTEAASLTEDLSHVLMACWAHLLHRLSGKQNMVIHRTFDGRTYDEIAQVQGLFARSLPVSIEIEKEQSSIDLASAIKTASLERRDYQDYFVPPTSLSESQEIAFEYHDVRPTDSHGTGAWRLERLDACFDNFELKLVCLQNTVGTKIELQYERHLFDREDMERLLDQFLILATQAVSHPLLPLELLLCVGKREQSMFLSQLCATQTRDDSDVCVHRLFEAQAALTPDAVAVLFQDRRTTYAQLNMQANRLARQLRERGIGPEVRACLCLERSLEMVVGVLGILKCGGAYVPLNPADPATRMAMILADSQAQVLCTQDSLMGQFPNLDIPHLLLDKMETEDMSGENLADLTLPASLAYLIYTSGTTGKPKGVMITHRGLANYLFWCKANYLGDSEGIVPLFSPISFDMSVTSLFLPLISGLAIRMMAPATNVETLSQLKDLLFSEDSLAFLKLTPSHLEGLARLSSDDMCVTGRPSFIIGGEALGYDTLQFWRTHAPGSRFINEYGPTETVVGCCVFEAEPQAKQSGPVPIGNPIANTSLHLLDKYLNPTPTWALGQLFIAGEGVARGYLARPQLTAETFIPNPYSGVSGDRLYRTGDQVRLMATGSNQAVLEYIGRLDQQVKIRGYRIELSEIEVALTECSNLRDAAVLHRTTGALDGEHQLVAFVVPSSTDVNADAVRASLKQRLPDYMIPSSIVFIESLPLTDNGKVDRKALADLPVAPAETERLNLPANALEEVLALLWADVTKQSPDAALVQSVDKPFFDLGGHSLVLILYTGRVRSVFKINPNIRTIFKNGSIAKMAIELLEKEPEPGYVHHVAERLKYVMSLKNEEKYLRLQLTEEQVAQQDTRDLISKLDLRLLNQILEKGDEEDRSEEILPRPDLGERPLSFDQQSLWLIQQLDKRSNTYNNPMVLRFTGPLNPALLQCCFSEIEKRHESLRTTFRIEDGAPIQVTEPQRARPLILIDLSGFEQTEKQDRLQHLIEQEAEPPFDLEKGPIWRATLARLSSKDHVLMFTMHHICSDAWSMRLLTNEVCRLYDYFSKGGSYPLEPLPIQYVDYAWWQRQYLSKTLPQHLSFWKEYLRGASFEPILNADRPRPALQTDNGAFLPIRFSAEISHALEELGKVQNLTLFMVLLTAFYITLRQESGRDDVLVGTDLANRDKPEIAKLIGFFINQLVLRGKLNGNPTLSALMGRVRQSTLDAFTHRELPFEQLVKEMGVARNHAYAPLFQTKFFLVHEEILQGMPELDIEALPPGKVSARIDLTLGLWQGAQGISGWFNFNTDLFDIKTIERLASHLNYTIETMIQRPEAPLAELLDTLTVNARARREAEVAHRRESSAKKFQRGKRKTVSVAGEELVDAQPFSDQNSFILVLQAKGEGVDGAAWARANHAMLTEALKKHGALLFRGFSLGSVSNFQPFAHSVIDGIYKDNAEHQPLSEDGTVQTPVDYAADQHLLWHNENSFNWQWPQKILFACAQAPEKGGNTPLVDSRLFYQRIDPAIRERFSTKGVMYVRNYTGMLGLSWRQIFKTEHRTEVEALCREANLDFEWHHGDQLRTRAIRPGVLQHPTTEQWSWFNQAQHWHVSCLDAKTRASVVQVFEEADYPRNCYFGDGTRIEDSIIDEILGLYRELEVSFPWQQGDALLVDNIAAAHARQPYVGPRKILVCQGEMKQYEEGLINNRSKK